MCCCWYTKWIAKSITGIKREHISDQINAINSGHWLQDILRLLGSLSVAFVTSNNSFKSLIKTGRTWSIGQILDNFCFDCYIDRAAFDSEPCYRSGSWDCSVSRCVVSQYLLFGYRDSLCLDNTSSCLWWSTHISYSATTRLTNQGLPWNVLMIVWWVGHEIWWRRLYLFIIFMFLRLSRLQLICSCMLQRNYTRFFRKHSDRIKSCSWDDRSLKCWIAGWSPPSLPITALDFTESDFTESIIIIYDCKCFFFSSRGLHKRASCEYTKWRRSQTPFLQLQTHRSRFTCCICVMDAGLTFSRWDKVWCRRCSLSLFPPTRRAPKSHITKSTMCRAVCSSKSLHRCYLKKKKKMKTFKFLCTEFFLLILTGGESIWSFKSAPSV